MLPQLLNIHHKCGAVCPNELVTTTTKAMNRFTLRLFLFCMAIGCAISGSAQTKVTGRVLDENRQGVDAAVVLLVASPGDVLVESVLTDPNGQYSILQRKGEFLLCIRALGYKEVKRKMAIASADTLPDIQLEVEDVSLKDVVVTARKSRSLTSASNGKIRIHVAQSYLTDIGTALDVLRHSPGILVSNKGDISLATIGGTAIYVNGRKLMLKGEELSAYLRSLPSSKISSIETSPSPNASFGADGAGGVINIITKASVRSGFYLTTSHSFAYWENLRQSSDLALSYNTDKWQLGLNYNHAIGHHAMDYGYERLQDGNKYLSETVDTDMRNTYSAGIDFSWQATPTSKLFVNSSVNLLAGPGVTATETQVYQGTTTLDGILRARNDYVEQKTFRYSNSLNYLYRPSDKHQLSITADWTRFDGTARCEQPNTYYSATNMLVRSDFFYSQPDKDIDIYALLADYKYKPNDESEWLAGAKTSFIRSHNTFLFKKNGAIDNQRSNTFHYDEGNIEGYTQYTHTLGKLELSAGLRLEYMHTSSKLNAYSSQDGEEHSGSHLRLFPNLSISYALNEQSKVALLYSRRQDKPRYEDLNPFEYLLDELSYWKGNPFLKPQISNKLILSYVWNSLSLNLSYSKLDDYFTSITDALGTTKTVMTTKNIGAQQQVGLEGLFSKRLTPWWDFSANLGLYYFVNKLDYETYKEEYKRPSYLMSVSNSILLPLGLNLELSGRYNSKRQGGSYEVIKPNGSLDIGLSRMWADDRLRLSLLMTDIFHTDRWDNYGHKGALDLTTWFGSESRKVILRLSYSLGKQKFNKVESSLGELDRL